MMIHPLREVLHIILHRLREVLLIYQGIVILQLLILIDQEEALMDTISIQKEKRKERKKKEKEHHQNILV